MQNLCAEAKQKQQLLIQVVKFNQAVQFYEKLGFVKIKDTGTHCLMQWEEGLGNN